MVSLIVLTMVHCTFTILKKWALHPVVKLGFKSKQKKISHHILRPKSGHIYLIELFSVNTELNPEVSP